MLLIDIHSHILFDIDDGAQSIEESVALCRDAYESGIDTLICTPHLYNYGKARNLIVERDSKLEELRERLKEEKIPLKLLGGAEIFLHDGLFAIESLRDGATLAGTDYILCEFPMERFNPRRGIAWVDELISRGYRIIIAHPERYLEFHRSPFIIDELLDRGVVFQVNFDSLLGYNGALAQMMAVDMVERKIALFIASDAHDAERRNFNYREKIPTLPEDITDEMLEHCMVTVPTALLANEDLF